MGDKTGIEWTDATWNPTVGCSVVSPGCHNCYAAIMAKRLVAMGNMDYVGTVGPKGWSGQLNMLEARLDIPKRWTKPRRIFVNSMSDLFHESVPDEFIGRVFEVMNACPRHLFQVLTKRSERMASWVLCWAPEPSPNIILGVSVEDQKRASRAYDLAVVGQNGWQTMISAEPLLGAVLLPPEYMKLGPKAWVIVGGESGPDSRPMHPDWARVLRDQAVEAGVPFFFKQWGEFAPCPVFADPDFAGGRAFNQPGGGRSAAVIRFKPTRAFQTGETRVLRPGDVRKDGIMLENDIFAARVGKHEAGRELDGVLWDQMPPWVPAVKTGD